MGYLQKQKSLQDSWVAKHQCERQLLKTGILELTAQLAGNSAGGRVSFPDSAHGLISLQAA